MKKARMNISHSRFILFKLKIFGEIVTTNKNIRLKFYHSHFTLLTQSRTAFLCNQSRVFSQIMMLFVLYCSFLCNVLEASIFNKIFKYCRPKIKLFWQKNYRIIYQTLGAMPPDLQNSPCHSAIAFADS